jgi:hypothetical protein
MALTDPQTITVAGSGKVMTKVSSPTPTSTVYSTADEAWKLTISHQVQGEKIRSVARFDQKAIVADPLSAVNDFETLSTYIVLERPLFGFTSTNAVDQVAGLVAWLNATMVGKLYGREH